MEDFYEDLFEELSKYGEIESLNICHNLADHMVGNVYVPFREEEHAANALHNLTGRPIIVDFSQVVHLKKISRELRRDYLGDPGKGTAGFVAGAPIGTGAMKIGEGIIIMREIGITKTEA